MPADTTRSRVAAALNRLSGAGLDAASYRHEAIGLLRGAVDFDAWCWALVDPASGLPAHAVAHNPVIGHNQARFHLLGHAIPEVPGPADARLGQGGPVRVLSNSTGGDLRRSARWRELLGPGGFGDQMEARLVTDRQCWGHLALYRDAGGGWFTEYDCSFLATVAHVLAAQLRRSIRLIPPTRGLEGDEPGILVLDPELRLLAATPQAQRWLAEVAPVLPAGCDPLPGFVYALAARVASSPKRQTAAARVRVCSPAGRWLVLRGDALSSAASSVPEGSIVVTIEPARSGEIAPLLMRAWGLSGREREVTSFVLDGLTTEEIAAELFISHHTVRDHVRSVLGKVGVRSRRDLLAALSGGCPPNMTRAAHRSP